MYLTTFVHSDLLASRLYGHDSEYKEIKCKQTNGNTISVGIKESSVSVTGNK